MDSAAYSYTKDGVDIAMEEMKKECQLALEWLSEIPVNSWSRWDMNTNCQAVMQSMQYTKAGCI
jgi:hypothetical protein